MTGPLMILAFLSLAGGLSLRSRHSWNRFSVLKARRTRCSSRSLRLPACLASPSPTGCTSLSPSIPDKLASTFSGLYNLILNKYFVDEVYDATVVDPVIDGSRAVLWQGVDVGMIDATVNGVGSQARGMGMILRMLQSGNIRNYATWVVFGSVLLIAPLPPE